MSVLGTYRIFASHYQFILSDFDADMADDDPPPWTTRSRKRGCVTSKHVAIISGKAHLNDLVVSVEMADAIPTSEGADRTCSFKLAFPSGRVHVTGLLDENSPPYKTVSVKPGTYRVHVLSYNLGVDQMSTGDQTQSGSRRRLGLKARLARTDFERHRIVLINE